MSSSSSSSHLSEADIEGAKIIDRLLMTGLQQPGHLENLFQTGCPDIVNISLDLVKEVSMDLIPDRIKHLAALISKNPFVEAEFPFLCHLCFCKLNFNGLPDSQKSKILQLQNSAYQKLGSKMSDPNRFQQLAIFAHQLVYTFYEKL